MDDCKKIEQAFLDKFGVLPCISYQEVKGYGWNYCLWKSENMCLTEKKAFYKMGATLQSGLNYVDRLLLVPSAIMIFPKHAEKEKVLYSLQMEMNSLSEN